MMRAGDRVIWNRKPGVVRVLTSAQDLAGQVLAISGERMPADECELLCSHCTRHAVRFSSPSGAPFCESHALSGEQLADVRPDERSVCPCICGEDLAAGVSHGPPWTIGNVVCEYRTCLHCRSTRAFMAADVIPGVPTVITRPDSTTITETEGLLHAIEFRASEGAMISRGGVVLAQAFATVQGSHGWRVLAPVLEASLPSKPRPV